MSISVKTKNYPPNFHVDDWGEGRLKVLGILNSDWNSEKDGGGFICDGVAYKLNPTDFLIFDSNQTHANDTILSDKNRYDRNDTILSDKTIIYKRYRYLTLRVLKDTTRQ